MKTIKVVDAIMGAGKTSFAIQEMNRRTSDRFLYITPFKSEIDRIVEACPGFRQPVAKKDPSDPGSTPRKLHHLKQLMREGVSIASSHKLFEDIDAEVLRLAEDLGYILILDEVMDVLKQPPRKAANGHTIDPNEEEDTDEAEAKSYREWIDGLLSAGVLTAAGDGSCTLMQPGPESRLTEYSHLRKFAAEGRLVLVDGFLLIWQFPADTFRAFKEVWNLTYLFDGTYQKAYYDLHDLSYERLSVVKEDGIYRTVAHSPEHDRPIIEAARNLIRVYDGTKNSVGVKNGKSFPLSRSWWKTYRKQGRKLMDSTSQWFKRLPVDSTRAIWTVHKSVLESKLFPRGFKEAHVTMNTRATNAYRDRTAVAYLVNRFFNVPVEKYFKALNVAISQDQFALSEMIQFIWRSAIRDGKPIDLFVPSARMRGLLFDWFNGNLGNLHPPVQIEEYEPEEVKEAA
jgi:hypothetical protein